MPAPKQKEELTKYLDNLANTAKDARSTSRFAQRYKTNQARFLARGRPDSMSGQELWITISANFRDISIAFGIIARADREIVAYPVGEEDQKTAEVFTKVAEVEFDEDHGCFFEAGDEGVFEALQCGYGANRDCVGRDGQFKSQNFSPLVVIVDPKAKAQNFSDRGYAVLYCQMPIGDIKERLGIDITHGDDIYNTIRADNESAGKKTDVTIAEIEWWCPANGKVWFDGSLTVIDNPDDLESAVPESDRADLSIIDAEKKQGYWRLSTIIMSAGDKDSARIIQDKPTGLKNSIWSFCVLDHEQEDREGAVGLGDRLTPITDAVSGAISLGLQDAADSQGFVLRLAEALNKRTKNAIESGKKVVIDNLGEDVNQNSDLIQYPSQTGKLFEIAQFLAEQSQIQSTVTDTSAGISPGASAPGVSIDLLQNASANALVRWIKNINAFYTHKAKTASEMLQRKVPYGKLVRIADPENLTDEKQKIPVTIGVEPPEGYSPDQNQGVMLLTQRNAPLHYDIKVKVDIQESINRHKREAEAKYLLDKNEIDLEAYLDMTRHPRSQAILDGLNKRNRARRIAKWILEHPDDAAEVEAKIELEMQAEALGIPLTEEQEQQT